MIFVAFGNSPKQFLRLAKAVDALARDLHELVFVQSGFTKYNYIHATSTQFLTQEEFASKLKESSVVILQGGWGGISEASLLGCRIVAVPRTKGLEHYHDQVQLVKTLEEQGILIGCYDIKKLASQVAIAKEWNFKPISKGDASSIINDFIQTMT